MAFDYCRTIRFHETDAAGVVYFANVLTLCHEAYEASIMAEGFDMALFFSAVGEFALPIVHAQTDFYKPMRCGDRITISLTPKQIDDVSFEISYVLYLTSDCQSGSQSGRDKPSAKALTRHLCIQPRTRQRMPLPNELIHWIETTESSAESSALSD